MAVKLKKKPIEIIFVFAAIIFIMIMWGMDIMRILDWKIPNEIREGANAAIVDSFVQGINPYRKLVLENGFPSVFYMYPILNNLIAAAIVKLTSIQSGMILLVLNMLWTLGTGLLLSSIVKSYVNDGFLIILSFLLSHYCGWRYTNVSSFPDMLGVFLMVCIMFICTKYKASVKTVSILAVLTVLCFYSKQYMLVVGLPVAIYLLLNGYKKECLIYLVETAGLGLTSAVIIYAIMPVYFIETLLLVRNSSDNEWRWAFTQFIKMSKLFFPWLMVTFIWIMRRIHNKRQLLDYAWINLCSMTVLLFYFGQNTGAHLSYYLQLWFPAIIVIGMRALNEIIELLNREWSKYAICICALIAAIYPYYWLHTPQLTDQQRKNWNRMFEMAETFDKILATSQMANYMISQDEYIYDYGQNQYIFRNETIELWKKWEQSAFMNKLFPEFMELEKTHEQYRQYILAQLDKKEYEVLMLVDNFGFSRDWKEFQNMKDDRYELEEEIEVETGVWKWKIGIWR